MITEYKLEDAGREMLITIKRSSRKTLGLEVRENGEIFARIPEKLSDRSLKSFIEKERDWIIKKSELVIISLHWCHPPSRSPHGQQICT